MSWGREALALSCAALLLTLAFPRFSLWPLALVALVPTLWACESHRCSRAQAFRRGWAMGFLAHLGILWWIARLYATEITYPWMRVPMLVLLAAIEGLFSAGAFWAWNALGGSWWAWPGAWVLCDYARSLTRLAFPWTVLANALSPSPPLLQPAALGGVWLVDLLVAVVNVLVWRSLGHRRALAWAALLVGAWLGAGAASMGREGGSLRVAVVQPNALPEFKWERRSLGRVLGDLETLTASAVDSLGSGESRLVVWPETALPVVVEEGRGVGLWLERVSEGVGVPILTGTLGTALERGERLLTNAAVLARPGGGLGARYDKMHLVPFSEKMPFSEYFPALKRLNFGQGDYARGRRVVLLPLDGIPLGVLICFEAILPGLVRRHVREGAQVLVNITNDSWFGNTGACEQHAAIAVMRTVEHRRWMVRAANTGVSLIADPWGRVVARTGVFVPQVLVGAVRPRASLTPYARLGDWVVGLSAVLVAWGIARRCAR